MQTFVIGDIHGGLKALKQVMERGRPNPNDTLIFLGDYVDGWSESAETIEFLLSLKEHYNCKFIRGNHDTILYDYLKHNKMSDSWLVHGGRATISSYKKVNADDIHKHVTFLEKLDNYYIDNDNRLFVHAGFTSMHGPSHELDQKSVYWDRTLWEMARCLDPAIDISSPYYPKRLLLFKEIYIGHTPTTNYDVTMPMNFQNLWNIDTGAAFKGSVSMMEINTKKIVQSDSLPSLYPTEKGRNA
jgi:serine/threonine protein phosphatase 1